MLPRPYHAFTTIPLRLYHVLTTLILRPKNDYRNLTTLNKFSLRHTMINPTAKRSYHASSSTIALSYQDHYTILASAYRDPITLSSIISTSYSILILFHSFQLSLISRIPENNTDMPPTFTRTCVRGGRGSSWVRWVSGTNPYPVEMSNQQSNLNQRIANPSRSNDDIS